MPSACVDCAGFKQNKTLLKMIVWGLNHVISQESLLADLSYLLVHVYCFCKTICRDRNTLHKHQISDTHQIRF